jgi:hypothetical protein
MPMNNNKRLLAIAFLTGLSVAIADTAYFEYASNHQIMTPNPLWLLLLCLNPPAFLSVMFIDVKPTTMQMVVLQFVIAWLNGFLYASVASSILRMRRRSA